MDNPDSNQQQNQGTNQGSQVAPNYNPYQATNQNRAYQQQNPQNVYPSSKQGYNRVTNQGYNRAPNQGYNQAPNQGYNRAPNQGYNQAPNPYRPNNFAVSSKYAGAISSHLAGSILVTIFCCIPFGIPAIVFAAQVNGLLAQGKIQEAMQASKTAAMWMWIGFGIGLGVQVLYVLAMIISNL